MQFVAHSSRKISSSTWPSGESTVRPPEIVVHTKARPSAAKAMPSGTWPSLSCANALAGRIHDVQPAGLTLRVAVVALGARVGEPEAAVGAEGQVVRAGQLVPGD